MKVIVLLSILLLMTGCSNQPDAVIRTYMLPTVGLESVNERDMSLPLLVIEPVEMADYIDAIGLVYQTSETEVVQAKHNLWAESIAEQLTHLIQNDLRLKQARYWPTYLSKDINDDELHRLKVRFTKFNAHYSGDVIINGEWLVINGKDTLKKEGVFHYRIPLEKSGYDYQVKALSLGVSKLTTYLSLKLQ